MGAGGATGLVRGTFAGLTPAALAARVAVEAFAGREEVRFGTVATVASLEKSSLGPGSSPGSGNIAVGSLVVKAENFGVLSDPGILDRLFGFRMKTKKTPAIPIDRHVINAPSSSPLPPDSSSFDSVAGDTELTTGFSFAMS